MYFDPQASSGTGWGSRRRNRWDTRARWTTGTGFGRLRGVAGVKGGRVLLGRRNPSFWFHKLVWESKESLGMWGGSNDHIRPDEVKGKDLFGPQRNFRLLSCFMISLLTQRKGRNISSPLCQVSGINNGIFLKSLPSSFLFFGAHNCKQLVF